MDQIQTRSERLMLLEDRTGISCDFCSLIFKEKFVYYSIEDWICVIKNNIRVAKSRTNFDKDMCEQCYANIIEEVKANIQSGVKPRSIKCDLSREIKSGDFEYHVLNFHKVSVDKNIEPYTSVEKQVMDLNVISRYSELVRQTEVAKSKLAQKGSWS